MVERISDSEDRKLQALFASTPIADDGFSRRVMARIRRQILVQRFSLPVAFMVGAAIAAKPVSQLIQALYGLLQFIPQTLASNIGASPLAQVPQLSTIVMGGTLLLFVLLIGRLTQRR